MSDEAKLVVTATPNPKARDVAAAKLLDAYASHELSRVRATAEKWTSGLAALIAVLSTAVVIKGPESFEGLDPWARITVVVAMFLGGGALAFGVFSAYQASAGSSTKRSSLDRLASEPRLLEGTADAWRTAITGLISESRSRLKRATIATLIAALLLAAAIGFAWLGPRPDDDGAPVCVTTSNGTVELDGALPKVSDGSLEVVPCGD